MAYAESDAVTAPKRIGTKGCDWDCSSSTTRKQDKTRERQEKDRTTTKKTRHDKKGKDDKDKAGQKARRRGKYLDQHSPWPPL